MHSQTNTSALVSMHSRAYTFDLKRPTQMIQQGEASSYDLTALWRDLPRTMSLYDYAGIMSKYIHLKIMCWIKFVTKSDSSPHHSWTPLYFLTSLNHHLRAFVMESPARPAISLPLLAANTDKRVADNTTALPRNSRRTLSQRSTTYPPTCTNVNSNSNEKAHIQGKSMNYYKQKESSHDEPTQGKCWAELRWLTNTYP